MNLNDRKKAVSDIFEACLALADKKGQDYSAEFDSFENFKHSSTKLGITVPQVVLVHLDKHMAAINNCVRKAEPLKGDQLPEHIKDAINYLAFLYIVTTNEARVTKSETEV